MVKTRVDRDEKGRAKGWYLELPYMTFTSRPTVGHVDSEIGTDEKHNRQTRRIGLGFESNKIGTVQACEVQDIHLACFPPSGFQDTNTDSKGSLNTDNKGTGNCVQLRDNSNSTKTEDPTLGKTTQPTAEEETPPSNIVASLVSPEIDPAIIANLEDCDDIPF